VFILTAILAPRVRTLRVVAALLPALALFGPLIWSAIRLGNWRVLVADPGPAVPSEPGPIWLQALGWPSTPVLPSFVPSSARQVVAALVIGIVLVPAIAGLFHSGPPGRAVRIGWVGVVLGIGLIFAVDRVFISVTGLEVVRPWMGGAASLILAGLLTAAAAGMVGVVGRPSAAGHRARRILAGFGVAALVAGPVAGCALVTWQWWSHEGVAVSRTDTGPIPAIAVAEAEGELATSTLVVSTTKFGTGWDLIRGAGHELSDPDGILGARRLTGIPGTAAPPDAASGAIDSAVAAIVGRNPGDVSRSLAMAGIGFVLVPQVEDSRALAAAMDATPGLARITDAANSVLWRVSPGDLDLDGGAVDRAGRLHLVDQEKAVALAVKPGVDTQASVPAGAGPRSLVLAERADPRWRATLNGKALTAIGGDSWQQSFEVPSDGGTVRISYRETWPLPTLQVVVLVLFVLIAIPIRRGSRGTEAN
jgi:hypothetical protein